MMTLINVSANSKDDTSPRKLLSGRSVLPFIDFSFMAKKIDSRRDLLPESLCTSIRSRA